MKTNKPIRKRLAEMRPGDIFKILIDGKKQTCVLLGISSAKHADGYRTVIAYHPIGAKVCCQYIVPFSPFELDFWVFGNEANQKKKAVKTALIVTAITAAITAIIISFALGIAPPMERVEWEEVEHHVQDGQTLWEISKLYCPEKIDCREWIEEVKEINGIGSTIYAGDCLTVLSEKMN